MNLNDTKKHIIRWVSTSETWEHLEGITMAITNCLLVKKRNCIAEDVEEAEQEVNEAIVARIKELGLKPIEDNVIYRDTDNAYEGIHYTDSINLKNQNLKK